MTMKHVIIGGGTGFIGSALKQAFKERGAKVTVISQRKELMNMTWKELSLKGLPEDTTHVINVSGENVLNPIKRWTEEFKKNVWNSRIQTTQLLASAVCNRDVEFFATISGVAYYKPSDKKYTEYDQCEKYDFLSELSHAWEEAAKLTYDSKCRTVTIRSGVVLGPTGGMIQQMFLPFSCGLGGPLGTGQQYLPWIHISDLVNLFIFSAEKKNVKGILNGVAPEIITNQQFTTAFSKAMWRPAIIRIPSSVINLIFSEERAKIILEGQKVIPKRVLEYKFKYQYPTIQLACEQICESF